MPASLDLSHEAALEAELAAISTFETAIRQLQAGSTGASSGLASSRPTSSA